MFLRYRVKILPARARAARERVIPLKKGGKNTPARAVVPIISPVRELFL